MTNQLSVGGKVILCVDDEPATAAMFEHALANLGHEAVLATSGEEALAIVGSRQIDLILADSQSPRMSGLELIDALDQHGYRVPVVIIMPSPGHHPSPLTSLTPK